MSSIEPTSDSLLSINNDSKKISPSQHKNHLYAVFILNHLITTGIITTEFDPFSLDTLLIQQFDSSEFNSLYKKRVKSIQNAIVSSSKPDIINIIVK